MAGSRRTSSPVPASLPLNDDMVAEILLHLAPAPSSLPRASLVCKRWRRLISGPDFLRLFRARHRRNAPLLGFFTQGLRGICFTPTLEPPDRIPSVAFSFLGDLRGGRILCCRHGLLLLFIPTRLMVWDLSAGYLSELSVPLGMNCWTGGFNGMVFRDGVDAHGDEHFQVVMVGTNSTRAFACVYSSETDEWGKPISTVCPSSMASWRIPGNGTLVARSLYWALYGNSYGVLEFDLDKQCLTVIDMALSLPLPNVRYDRITVMSVGDGLLGCIFESIFNREIQQLKRSADCDGDSGWVLERSIDLNNLIPQSLYEGSPTEIVGIAEEYNVIYVQTKSGVFKVHLGSVQCKKVSEMSGIFACHSFTSIYTAGYCLLIQLYIAGITKQVILAHI